MNKKSARDWVISLAPWLPSSLTAHCLRRRPKGWHPSLATVGKPNPIHPHPTTTTCAILVAPTPCPCKNQQSINENSFFATMDVEIGFEIIERFNSEFKQLSRNTCIPDLGNMFQNCRKMTLTITLNLSKHQCHLSRIHLSQFLSCVLSAYAFTGINFRSLICICI